MLASSESLLLNFDMRTSYAVWLQIMADAAIVQELAPNFQDPTGVTVADPAWASGFTLLLERYTRWYGDLRLAQALYPQAMAYLMHQNAYAEPLPPKAGVSQQPLLQASYPGSYYGDWLAPGTDAAHVSNLANAFFHIRTTAAVLSLAQLTGHQADVPALQANLTAMKAAYGAFFFNSTAGAFIDPYVPAKSKTGADNGPLSFQTAQVLPLYLGVGTAAQRQQAATNLAHDVSVTQGGHVSTGVIGLGYLGPMLHAYGMADSALDALATETVPSLGYMALQDGSLWEQFDADGSFSRNHQMFSSAIAFDHEVSV